MDSGQNLAAIYDSSQSGSTQLAISSTNNNVITQTIELKYAAVASVQILTDGGAKINWTYQVTNLPLAPGFAGRTYFGATARDDTYASPMWSTVTNGQIPAGAGNQGTIFTLATTVHRVGRVLLNWDATNTAGTSAKVFAVVRTMGYD